MMLLNFLRNLSTGMLNYACVQLHYSFECYRPIFQLMTSVIYERIGKGIYSREL